MAKFIKLLSGDLAEGVTKQTSAGAADADAIPSLNAQGRLDPSLVNSTQTSAGAADAAKVAALDSSGRLDASLMPVGFGADVATILASENIGAGDLVNVHNVAGAANVRRADASNGRRAHGFSLLGASTGAPCQVYFEGRNTAVSARTPGAQQYLSGSTPGASTETPPSTAGHISQQVGSAVSATSYDFEPRQPVTLA